MSMNRKKRRELIVMAIEGIIAMTIVAIVIIVATALLKLAGVL